MTKINLLTNSGRAAQPNYPGTSFTGTRTDFAFSGESSTGQVALKIFCALLIPALLIYYERDNLGTKRVQLVRFRNELNSIESELAAKSSTAEVLKQYTTEKTKLENEMETVRQLNKSRLREIKALDSLQAIVPGKVWLHHISIEGKKMSITGYSLSAEDISAFIQSMEESVFFTEVLLTSSTEESSKKGQFKKFELRCGLEIN